MRTGRFGAACDASWGRRGQRLSNGLRFGGKERARTTGCQTLCPPHSSGGVSWTRCGGADDDVLPPIRGDDCGAPSDTPLFPGLTDSDQRGLCPAIADWKTLIDFTFGKMTGSSWTEGTIEQTERGHTSSNGSSNCATRTEYLSNPTRTVLLSLPVLDEKSRSATAHIRRSDFKPRPEAGPESHAEE